MEAIRPEGREPDHRRSAWFASDARSRPGEQPNSEEEKCDRRDTQKGWGSARYGQPDVQEQIVEWGMSVRGEDSRQRLNCAIELGGFISDKREARVRRKEEHG